MPAFAGRTLIVTNFPVINAWSGNGGDKPNSRHLRSVSTWLTAERSRPRVYSTTTPAAVR
jgi:hypothetical protein